jgi:hypothetical protein
MTVGGKGQTGQRPSKEGKAKPLKGKTLRFIFPVLKIDRKDKEREGNGKGRSFSIGSAEGAREVRRLRRAKGPTQAVKKLGGMMGTAGLVGGSR